MSKPVSSQVGVFNLPAVTRKQCEASQGQMEEKLGRSDHIYHVGSSIDYQSICEGLEYLGRTARKR